MVVTFGTVTLGLWHCGCDIVAVTFGTVTFLTVTLWLWHCCCDIMAVTLRLWHCCCDIAAVTLWMWHCGCNIAAVTLWMWPCGCDIAAVTLLLWHCGCDIVAVTLWMWHCGCDLPYPRKIHSSGSAQTPRFLELLPLGYACSLSRQRSNIGLNCADSSQAFPQSQSGNKGGQYQLI